MSKQTRQKAADTVADIDSLLEKIAAGRGESNHPTERLDDQLAPAVPGERIAEHVRVAKEDPISHESAPAVKPKDKLEADIQNGDLNPATSGRNPDAETGSVTGKIDEPPAGTRGGTTHPANANNPKLDSGSKSASALTLESIAEAQRSGEALLAAVAGGLTAAKTAAAYPAVNTQPTDAEIKEASDQAVFTALEATIADAADRAQQTVAYLASYQKQAEAGLPAEMMPPAAAPEAAPPEAAPAAPEAGGMDLEQVIAQMSPEELQELEAAIVEATQGGEAAPAGGEAAPDQDAQLLTALMAGGEGGAPAAPAPEAVPTAEGNPQEDEQALQAALEAEGVNPAEFAAKAASFMANQPKVAGQKVAPEKLAAMRAVVREIVAR